MQLTIKHKGLARRIIGKAVISSKTGESVTVPTLWDTGATNSMITVETAQKLDLEFAGCTKYNHAGGTSTTIKYFADIEIQDDLNPDGLKIEDIKLMTSQSVPGMLIGMDIIAQGRFCIDSVNGNTVFTFDFDNSRYTKEP